MKKVKYKNLTEELKKILKNEELTEIGKDIAKQKRPKKSEQMSVHTNPGDNTKYLNHSLRLYNLPKIDTTNLEQLKERIQQYFQICAEDDMKPSVAGMAVAIGTDRRRVWEWANVEKSDRTDVIKRAYSLLDLQMTDYMQNGKINPVSGIFLMKNHFGYTDKQEIVVEPKNPLGEQKDVAQIEDAYIESVATEILTDEE